MEKNFQGLMVQFSNTVLAQHGQSLELIQHHKQQQQQQILNYARYIYSASNLLIIVFCFFETHHWYRKEFSLQPQVSFKAVHRAALFHMDTRRMALAHPRLDTQLIPFSPIVGHMYFQMVLGLDIHFAGHSIWLLL